MSSYRKLLVGVVFFTMLPPAWAGIPVHDAPAQALRARQLAAAREHLEKAREVVHTLRGVSGFGNSLQSLDQMHVAPSLEEIKKVFANLSRGGSGTSAVDEVRRRARIPRMGTLAEKGVQMSEGMERRLDEESGLHAYYQARAEDAYLLAERRRPALSGLQDALGQAHEVKQVLDLQTLVLIEIAHQINDNNQLMATLIQMQAHRALMEWSKGIDYEALQ